MVFGSGLVPVMVRAANAPGKAGECVRPRPLRGSFRRCLPSACAVLLAAFLSAGAPARAETAVSLELNKLEPVERGCRIYLVVANSTAKTYQSFKLDLVLFQPTGVIGKRVAVDLAPIRPSKRTVKLFDLDDQPCDRIGSVLINDVLECSADGAAVADCLGQLDVKSLSNVQLSK